MKVICGGLLEKDRRFLLVNAKVGVPKGLWNIPAGKLEGNELVTDCAAREVEEETGLKVEIEGLIGTYNRIHPSMGIENIRINFKMKILGGKLTLPEDEIEKAEWFTPEEIQVIPEDKIAFGVKETIRDYLERGCVSQQLLAVRKEQV